MRKTLFKQTWFNFDWKEALVEENKKIVSDISTDKQTPEQIEAIAQYQPNSTLIPLLLLGIPPNPIYQFRPIAEDDYDEKPDVDNMPDYMADGNDPVDYKDLKDKSDAEVKEAMENQRDVEKKYTDAIKKAKEAAEVKVEKTTAQDAPVR